MWCAYALQSVKDGWLYVGMSSDVERRLVEHNRGYNRSTRVQHPSFFCTSSNVPLARKQESARSF